MPRIYEIIDAPADASTTYSLSVGTTIQGSLSSWDDEDFYRVYVTAGQVYTFSLVGTGTNDLAYTALALYGADGTTVLAGNSGGLPFYNSRITYTATTSGYVYLDAKSQYGAAGQYDLNVDVVARPTFDPQTGAGMIDSGLSWSATRGTGVTVTWAARRTGQATDAQGVAAPFSQFSQAEIDAVTRVLALISEVSGIVFQRVDDGDGFSDNASMLFGNYFSTTDGAGAYAAFPSYGEVWANLDSVSTTNLSAGTYSFWALMHEIGHAVGLSHPGRYNAQPGVTISYANNAQFQQDSVQYTVMSYFDESSTGGNYGTVVDGMYYSEARPNSPMLLDIMALQNIYGANMNTRTGATVYGYNGTAGASFNFSAGARAFCIWDAGGDDTLDGSGYGGAQTLDLRQGYFSNMAGKTSNVSIAYGATIENATGGAGADTLLGNAAANRLFGGAGADVMRGFGGDDIYFVDSAADIVIDRAGEGFDTVFASVSYALRAGEQIEQLSAFDQAATATLNLAGNEFGQTLVGNAGVNLLNGGGGLDTLQGLGGDDVYIVDSAGDLVLEAVGGGNDQVRAVATYALRAGQEIERLSVYDVASTAAINLSGNEFAQALVGSAGANVLDGGGGADMMYGLGGDDIYIVDNANDAVNEAVGAGYDQVRARTSYFLRAGQEIERLMAFDPTSTATLNLTGNAFAQTLIGNGGVNLLNGGAGADVMQGLGGDDVYIVDDAGDVVLEAVGGGTDQVRAMVSWQLRAGQAVERLSVYDAASTAAITLTGNEFAQTLVGGAGVNVLNGGGGADVMYGLGGDDVYIVDNANDLPIEAVGQGTDAVRATISYTLRAGQEIERLSAFDQNATAAITLVGNEFSQTLVGAAGADVLDGRGGSDNLVGLGGADTFLFDTALGALNVDRIVDFVAGEDHIALDPVIFSALSQGALAGDAFSAGAVGATTRIFYNASTGGLFYDPDGAGSVYAATRFATMSTGLTLGAGDFVVV